MLVYSLYEVHLRSGFILGTIMDAEPWIMINRRTKSAIRKFIPERHAIEDGNFTKEMRGQTSKTSKLLAAKKKAGKKKQG